MPPANASIHGSLHETLQQLKLLRPQDFEPEHRLVRHTARPQWGVGLWVKEERRSRHVRFQRGGLRCISRSFYHLLEPVNDPDLDVDRLYEELAGKHEAAELEQQEATIRDKMPPVMSFEQQLEVFLSLYPGGFAGAKWLNAVRRPESGRARKAHLDPVIELAKVQLSREVLAAHLEEGDAEEVVKAALLVLSSTSLVKPADTAHIKGLSDVGQRIFAEGLMTVLHGEGAHQERFVLWLKALKQVTRGSHSWPLVTALPALMSPDERLFVSRQVYRLQAREVRPGAIIAKEPGLKGYRSAGRVANATRTRLETAGLAPADLMDVSLFIWETLRPKGRGELDRLRGNT